MTKEEARDWIKQKMGNDYYFLPLEAEEKWIKELIDGTFFKDAKEK
jgi:hypothetical protein